MIQIKKKLLAESEGEGMDEFLSIFSKAYKNALGGDLSKENMHLLNGNQHTLLAFSIFSEEVRDGGFVQLIQNGYGAYIFDNPFAKAMRQYGAKDLSKLIYRAKEIYDANKAELERETTEEEFTAMYVDFEVFDEIEEQYFEIEEQQTAIIAAYVEDHLDLFAEIV